MAQQSEDWPPAVHLLEPEALHFWRTPGGMLRMELSDQYSCLKVEVARAFPLSHRDQYISIRDGNKRELGMIRSLQDLPREEREILEQELDRRYFLPSIERIEQIRERFGIAEWQVVTSRGPRRFVTKHLHDSVVEVEPGRYLIKDVDDNRYEIPNLSAMDPASAAILGDRL